jgi:hypothetical protein
VTAGEHGLGDGGHRPGRRVMDDQQPSHSAITPPWRSTRFRSGRQPTHKLLATSCSPTPANGVWTPDDNEPVHGPPHRAGRWPARPRRKGTAVGGLRGIWPLLNARRSARSSKKLRALYEEKASGAAGRGSPQDQGDRDGTVRAGAPAVDLGDRDTDSTGPGPARRDPRSTALHLDPGPPTPINIRCRAV